MTNTRALTQLNPPGSVADRIKHEASDMFTYCEKSSNPVRSFSYPLRIDYFLWWLLQVNYKQTGWLLFQINFDVYLKSSFIEAVLSILLKVLS